MHREIQQTRYMSAKSAYKYVKTHYIYVNKHVCIGKITITVCGQWSDIYWPNRHVRMWEITICVAKHHKLCLCKITVTVCRKSPYLQKSYHFFPLFFLFFFFFRGTANPKYTEFSLSLDICPWIYFHKMPLNLFLRISTNAPDFFSTDMAINGK